MDLIIRFLISLALVFGFSSCAGFAKEKEAPDSLYEQGYRDGAKENIDKYLEVYQGGDFPYFHWGGPIVQYVEIPAHIENGVFIPAHYEPVLIKPGYWKSNYGYPIKSTNRRDYEKEEDIIRYFDANAVDLTVLPQQPSSRESEQREESADSPRRME